MAPVPAHVPASAVVDFEYFRLPGAERDPFAALKRLHAGPELFWTGRYDGHWTVTRGEAIRRILADHENFSSRVVFIPPQQRPRFIPLEIDPPEHSAYRALLTPALTPKAVGVWAQEARALAIALIEQFRPLGRCEFIADFAQQLPIVVFLKMCNLPLEDRAMLLEWVGASLRPTSLAARDAAGRSISDYVERWLAKRRANPGDDLFSRIATSEIGGRRLSEQEALSMGRSVLGGGLDTVAASMGFAALFLARHPAHVQQLVEDPRLIPNAVDEFCDASRCRTSRASRRGTSSARGSSSRKASSSSSRAACTGSMNASLTIRSRSTSGARTCGCTRRFRRASTIARARRSLARKCAPFSRSGYSEFRASGSRPPMRQPPPPASCTRCCACLWSRRSHR
jgi:hypothetical protein